MKIHFPDGHIEEIMTGGETIERVIQQLDLNPLDFLISLEGEIISEDTSTTGIELIRLIRISHGG